MPIAFKRPHSVSLNPGWTIDVTADAESEGLLTVYSGAPSYTRTMGAICINPGQTRTVGPCKEKVRCKIEPIKGALRYLWHRPAPPLPVPVEPVEFQTKLEHATSVVRSHRVIAEALNERKQLIEEIKTMGLHEKFVTLAERARTVPKMLEARADEAAGRLDRVEKRGDTAFGHLDAVMDDVEKGVAAAEDAVNQLTNGAPLDTSATS